MTVCAILLIPERVIILKDKSHLVEDFKYNLNRLTTEMLQSLQKALSETATLSRKGPTEQFLDCHFISCGTNSNAVLSLVSELPCNFPRPSCLWPAPLRCQHRFYLTPSACFPTSSFAQWISMSVVGKTTCLYPVCLFFFFLFHSI